MTVRLGRPLSIALTLTLAACRGDDEGSGDASEASGDASTSGSTGTTGADTSASASATGTTDPTGEGVRAHLDFTFIAPDAIDPDPVLGLAGAYHQTGLATDDIFALQGLQLELPPPPAAVDTVEEHAPTPFEWGDAAAWVSAGTAIKLVHAEAGEVLACRYQADDAYPLYLASAAAGFPAECAPDPARWQPDAEYRLVLYGGDAFADRVIDGRVTTPPALTVSAPDLAIYDLSVDTKADLAFTWEASEGEGRIIIQIWDHYDQLVSVHAADDGAFTVPAANLAALSAGPGFITVARERPLEIPFEGGTVRVVTRYQVWGYIDLVE
ncbi:MAG TPA: hypothetical protein PKW35_06610 [Nannocystaceae bacterium]|nr:hypothetical protein [Nannocystaceae bacterium]